MAKKKSSIPGLAYFPSRDIKLPSAHDFLIGRQCVDGAEGLWRIGNKLYDLTSWMHSHPGGSEWLQLTKGTDITEAFETHHIGDRAERMLPKFFVREAKTDRSVPLTFKAEDFYKKFKQRALAALKNVNYHKPSRKSNIIADFLATTTFFSCLVAAKTQSWSSLAVAATFFTWTIISGHNYFHMRDNFRMYYFDISLMSSKDWRITHVMSHHMYPNTIWDHEIYTYEPFFEYLPIKNKSFIPRVFGRLYSPLVWFVTFYIQGIKRYCDAIFVWKKIELRDVVPFLLPSSMCLAAPTVSQGMGAWLAIVGMGSTLFSFIGLNAAHHHPDIFHDGDKYRESLDWGLLELDAVRERKVVDDNAFLVLTNFGAHSLHHLLPTVDHSYLPLCQSALDETCKEFGIGNEKFTTLELIRGQFAQLSRNEPKNNIR